MPRDFKTVLCPTDFSDASYHALEYGLRFARHADGTLLLTHILHVPAGDLYGEEGHTLRFSDARARIERHLAEIAATRLEGYAKLQTRIEVGDPAQEIIKMAGDCRVDLIICATHGRSGFAHLIMGSVAEKIIRHAPCPVFVVRTGVE